ncbi:hypothetical protein LVJ83_11885 [Uruburuella testudinis]|uniref:Uncharacterized protein n=1 Tax=Uruburuella testudinis TaxID=1282863 RepID=A0ABY4DRP9_9NEIS|nr:hypothetical protein [Uruburuella testudinis]UOO81608.1 hypothetical protein LVJ83_11885 [Uruburuella testudinis]
MQAYKIRFNLVKNGAAACLFVQLLTAESAIEQIAVLLTYCFLLRKRQMPAKI